MTSGIFSETLFTVVLVSAVVALAIGLRRNRPEFTGVGGAAIGLAALCRPIALLLPFGFLSVLMLMPSLPRRLLHGALLLGCMVLAITPWAVRCSRVSHQLVLVQGASAINFYWPTLVDVDQRNYPLIISRFRASPYGQYFAAARTPEQMLEADRVGLRQALQNVRAHPAKYLASRVRSFPYLFLSSFGEFTGIKQSFGAVLDQRAALLLAIKLVLLLLFSVTPFLLAVIGLTQARRNAAGALCAAVWVYTWLIHLPMWIEHRFWIPVAPFLLVNAVAGAHLLLGRSIARWSHNSRS